MGRFQTYKGNPEEKMLYVIDQLTGGVNTEYSDDTSPDEEFYSLINMELDSRGSFFKRMGFGKLNAVSEIFNMFESLPTVKGATAEDPNPELLNDNVVYMKMLKDDNHVFRNLSAFSGEKAYREYQRMYGAQNNTFKLLMITTNTNTNTSTAWIFTCNLPALEYDVNGDPTDTETIDVDVTVEDLPVVFTWNKNLLNIKSIEFFDKIFLTTNDKGLVIFNRTSDTFSYAGFNVMDGATEIVANGAYKPTPMDIRKKGFNVLGTDPLYWVDYQGISADSIQGVYLTTSDGIPVQNIPYGGLFRLHILYTGNDNGFTVELTDGDATITSTATANATLSKAGLKVYDVVMKQVPTSEVEFKITKTGASIEPYYDYYSVAPVDPETKAVSALNIGKCEIIEMYNRAVYYAGDTIWFSEINNFKYIPNFNYVSLPIEPTDSITSINFFKNVYIIFTKYKIYKMLGAFGESSFQILPVNLSIGCNAPDTIVPIENELYFGSPRGIYSLKSSEFKEGIENLKELDKKVKQLTSDVSMYLGELTEPAIKYNGIGDRAAAIRYKNKYMLFFNTAYTDGEITAALDIDALVYKYDLNAYVETRFAVKPTFLFMLDGAIETFCTVKEKEDYTVAEPLLEYDFETTGVTDKTTNGNDAVLMGNASLTPGYGIQLDGVNDYVKLPSLPSSIDFVNGFAVEIDAQFEELLANSRLFDLAQSTPSSSATPSSGEFYTSWANGYRAGITYTTTPNANTNTDVVSYTIKLYRDTTSRNASYTGSLNLKKGSTYLINDSAFSFNFGSALEVTIKTGTFNVTHDADGTYSEAWTLNVTTSYPTYSTGYNKGADVEFDVTKNSSFSSFYGIRFVGRAVAFDGYSRVYLIPYFHMASGASLSIGSRAAYAWINGVQKDFTCPAVSGSGPKDVAFGAETYVDVTYTGDKTISIDGRHNIRATINGTYRENLDVAAFDVVLPTITPYTITTWTAFTLTGTTTITLNTILAPSNRSIYAKCQDATDKLAVSSNSEYGSAVNYSGATANAGLLTRHVWKIIYEKGASAYNVYIYKDDVLLNTGTAPLNTVINSLKDSCFIGKSNSTSVTTLFKGSIYSFKLSYFRAGAITTPIVHYNFGEGTGTTVRDQSGNGYDGALNGGVTWLTEPGLRLDGVNSYLKLPDFGSDIRFSNGFTIEVDMKSLDATRQYKLLDLATSYDSGASSNGKSSINIGSAENVDNISIMSTSVNYKTMKLTKSDADLLDRHLWKFECVDNGTGYTLSIYKDTVLQSTETFGYGVITNILRRSNLVGMSNNPSDALFKGMIYSLKIDINASSNPVPVYVGSIFEYDTAYSDFGQPMDIVLVSKGINFKYPLHEKKLKEIYVKGIGGYNYQELFFEIYADGHLVNNPKIYNCYIDQEGQIVYDYIDNKELYFNEKLALLGNMRLGKTRLGSNSYETRKLVIPTKAKNIVVKVYGTSNDFLSIQSFGFTIKLGKVREK